MLDITKCLAVSLQCQHVRIRIYTAAVQHIHIKQMVAHLVRRIAQHQHDLFRTLRNPPQADGETVPAEDGEHYADSAAAQLCFYVCGNILG